MKNKSEGIPSDLINLFVNIAKRTTTAQSKIIKYISIPLPQTLVLLSITYSYLLINIFTPVFFHDIIDKYWSTGIMITIKDVEHVAKLARLELTEEEKEKFTKQLGDVLKHVEAMNEVDTSNVEPMAHAIDFVNVTREDKVFYEQTKEELMKNAPDEENGFFRVPKIN